MKRLPTLISFLYAMSFCNAQNNGRIIPDGKIPKAGVLNHYFYSPPDRLFIPDKVEVTAIYQTGKQFYQKTFPLMKMSNGYGFSFNAPDSTAVLVFSVADAKKQIIDNNNEAGYVSFLYDKKGGRYEFENISLASLLNGYAQFFLKLKTTPDTALIKLYEDSYRKHPELMQKDSYIDYLTVLYKEKGDFVKPKILDYAKEMSAAKNDEQKWVNAIRIYQLLNMEAAQQEIEKKAISNYPNGLIAKEKFWAKFNSDPNPTEQSILASRDEYFYRFKDSSDNVKDFFYLNIISHLLNNKQWDGVKKYEPLMGDKLNVANLYNNFAWKLSGEQIDNAGEDLESARALSNMSLYLIDQKIMQVQNDDQQTANLTGMHNTFADTYALILYKLGQYDSAFYYQDAIYKQGNELEEGGVERYAFYAEKIKGATYTKQVIEQQLLKGINSPNLIKKLQSIYKQLNLPENELNILQEKANLLAKEKIRARIIAKMGTIKANNFTLKNIAGQDVSLSSFKNKVVVIDFWATWCGPCRASFPAMQEMVNKYKEDSSVVFLFIDVWKRKSPEKMQEAAAKFIKDNNYTFNVLLDVDDKIVNHYKVEGIPAKFIIDKKGEIVFMDSSSNIALEIGNAKNL